MERVTNRFAVDPILDILKRKLETRGRVFLATVPLSVQALLAGWAAEIFKLPVVLVMPDVQSAEIALNDVATFYPQMPTILFSPDSFAVWQNLKELTRQPLIILAARSDLEAPAPQWTEEGNIILLKQGDQLLMAKLLNWLEEKGYERVDLVTEPGEYASRGGIIDIFPEEGDLPLRVEFADEVLVSLRQFEPLTQRSIRTLTEAKIFTRLTERGDLPAKLLLPGDSLVITEGYELTSTFKINLTSAAEAEIILPYQPVGSYLGNLNLLRTEIENSPLEYFIVTASQYHRNRLATLLGEKPEYLTGELSTGFVNQPQGWVVLTEREIYGTLIKRSQRRRFKGVPIDSLVGLRPGDYVVHIDYGVGVFCGTESLDCAGVKKDYLVLQYQGNDRVYLPVENLGLIDRYIASDDQPPNLDRLGGRSWLAAKARAARASAEYAQELIATYARRQIARTAPLPDNSPWIDELAADFPYEETPDQLRALADTSADLMSTKPMDRLVCGDVGFGKTEIALRAAFQTAINFKQVALLVPTTVLCYQHYTTFRRRLEKFPLRIEMLSRFIPPKKQQEVLLGLKNGTIDIVIGTHYLLNPRVQFRDLGLLIIDEEQRFGVKQKERIRQLKADVNCLYLSATPIPRTLYMALAGLKDISPIHTPPPGRKEVLTEVAEWQEQLIRTYVCRELNRNGQVFFVHNEIKSLKMVETRLRRILPDVEIVVAHGKIPPRRLAEIYLDFASGKYQLLLSTAIIESGIDLPNVNTIIVNRAERFGLADLHQLRGRVGRSSKQAYALFLVSSRQEMTAEARKRLSALLAYAQLGAGYRLALRDMEIRGVGNILGTEQHGHIARVGFNLYTQMLREAVAKIKGEELPVEPKLELELPTYIPENYISDSFQRVAIYRRLLTVTSEEELKELKAELLDRFGRYPPEVENLFTIAQIRLLCRRLGVLSVNLKESRSTVLTAERTFTISGGLPQLLEFLSHFRC